MKDNDSPNKDFLVVGLGASAGGVQALQKFFLAMPPNSGMAFVVILHLSPEHESNLPEILAARTQMPVIQVSETHQVEPNHVYVISPNQQLEMIDGVVRPAELKQEYGSRAAIDLFFRTLADAYGRNAVCIVLSGSGSDGTLGLKRIKESNGFAIVQDPEDAEYDSMPRSAITTGLVDWVLPINQMPEKLISFRASSERLHLTDGDDQKVAAEIQAEESLREILAILRVRTGHDFSNYKTPTLVRRIARHLQIHKLEDIPTYLHFLRENPDEIISLQRNLLINVTNFFRDKQAFEALEREVIPNIFAGKTYRDTVRVWTAACASGEEAYSVTMLLHEYAERLSDAPKIQVFATDVDDEAIAQAREHIYPNTIEADVSEDRLKRFFVREGSRYRIKKELRESVLFAPHNILQDPPFARLNLITCRNLLIYFNRETQERVMEIFHFALAAHGYLFLGTSETAENVSDFFSIVDKKFRIYSRRAASLAYHPPPKMPVVGKWQVNLRDRKTTARNNAFSLGEVHYKWLEEFAPPSILVNQELEVIYMSESVGRYLRFAGGEPTTNLLKLVNPDLLPDLRAALFAAQRERKSSEIPNIRAKIDGEDTLVNLIVKVVDDEQDSNSFLLVIFDEIGRAENLAAKKATEVLESKPEVLNKNDVTEAVVLRLEEDLNRTKFQLRGTIEQHEVSMEELKAANEELQAINKELRSATKELETGKEELQSVNEELTTVNHELKEKIDETTRINSDLQNLMAATDIATIFLDKNLRIKRYTPPVEDFFNITPSDVGRPLEHFTYRLNYEELVSDAARALRKLITVEREVSDSHNRYYIARFAPYRTVDDRIDGVVLNFINISERKQAEEQLRLAAELDAFRVELADALRPLSDPVEIQRTATRVLGEHLKADRTLYAEVKPDDEHFVIADNYVRGNFPKMTGRFSLNDFGKTPNSQRRGETLVLTDITGAGEREEHLAAYLAAGVRAIIGIPLIKKERWVASLTVHHGSPRLWTPEETALVSETAERTWAAIERARAEEALRESEENLRLLIKSIKEYAIFTIDKERRVRIWNPGAEQIFGWTAEEIIGQSSDIIFTPEDRENGIPEQEINTANAEGRAADERWHVRKDGSRFFVNGVVMPLSDNGTGGFVKIARDLTEQMLAAETLRASEERLKLATEAAALGSWDWDYRKDEMIWTKQLFDIFGLEPTKEMKVEFEEIKQYFHQEDLPLLIETSRQAWENQGSFKMEYRIRRADTGEERWISAHETFFYDEKKQPVRGVGIAQDITERKQAEQILLQSREELEKAVEKRTEELKNTNRALQKETEVRLSMERERVNLLQQIVHTQEDERKRIARDMHDQLGQQLVALRLKLDSLKAECDEGSQLGEMVEDAERVARRIDSDINFLARELRPVALDDLGLKIALDNYVSEWSKHFNIPAELHAEGLSYEQLPVEIEINLYRIVQEALNNAAKHSSAERVEVLIETRDNTLILIIEDNGKGFDESQITLRRDKGLGILGMKERALLIGGTLEIETGEGKGTTIFVRVPIESDKK